MVVFRDVTGHRYVTCTEEWTDGSPDMEVRIQLGVTTPSCLFEPGQPMAHRAPLKVDAPSVDITTGDPRG